MSLLSLMGCTDVELTDPSKVQDETVIQYNFAFASDVEKPDSMYVAFYKITKTHHYVDSVEIVPQVPANDGVASKGDGIEVEVPKEEFKVKTGEYTVLAFNKAKELDITNLKEFLESETTNLKDITIGVKETKVEEIPEASEQGWINFNPTLPYISNIGALYVATLDRFSIVPPVTTLSLTPQKITQRLNIEFKLNVVAGIVVEKVVAEISGLVHKENLLTRKLDESRTCKMIFTPENQSAVHTDGLIDYKGSIDVLGIIPGKNPAYVSGPGILQLAIYTTVDGQRKVFHRGINLIYLIRDADLLEMLADNTGRKIKKSEGTIKIETPLPIDNLELDNGVIGWFDSEKQNIDTEV